MSFNYGTEDMPLILRVKQLFLFSGTCKSETEEIRSDLIGTHVEFVILSLDKVSLVNRESIAFTTGHFISFHV